MHIATVFKTTKAINLLKTSLLAKQAYEEIDVSISNMIGNINNLEKNYNGVIPLKDGCYKMLEEEFLWYREKPLLTLSQSKGGPIDVYKEFMSPFECIRVGLEFETGNISSAHRSMNKLSLGLANNELDLAVILMPVSSLSYYLTDRVSNYEELEPYFDLVKKYPFIFIGFDAEAYSDCFPALPKGKDGMSERAIHKWKDK